MRTTLVPRARLKLAVLDPQLRRDLGIVAAYLLDEALGVLAPNEYLKRVTEWEAA